MAIDNAALDKLKGAIPDDVFAQIPDAASTFDISNNLRLAHFLAQCAHESAKFTAVKENLNYSADALRNVFPRYFPDANTAAAYARNPEKIGARVYANRMGNGDEASGEGYKYRGRGYIQLTGKNNYAAFGKAINEDTLANPDLVSDKYPLESAAYFFKVNNIWSVCDGGATSAVVTDVTKRVNGGTNGLSDRQAYFDKFWGLLR